MNFSSIILGLLLMIVGFFFTVVTFGFGIICTWPLLLIGFLLFILGIFSSSRFMQGSFSQSAPKQSETKQICSNCGNIMPLQASHCPHCGQENKYRL